MGKAEKDYLQEGFGAIAKRSLANGNIRGILTITSEETIKITICRLFCEMAIAKKFGYSDSLLEEIKTYNDGISFLLNNILFDYLTLDSFDYFLNKFNKDLTKMLKEKIPNCSDDAEIFALLTEYFDLSIDEVKVKFS